ncbi:carbon-nitrogen family hydrolase [Allobranchiibius sp. GilTou73]|uniref:carbon-nitrogen family hydrolase n=1 Tax=Allobranchiibius sp. GilTou73 TaxID=2904523 RepID=UPI001F1CD8EB|nr:carbon-nitrogen family hydrolase [Allobranchiibius sp. GilTou73]UIJ35262.1 carbon-nitrogen family hydrolase [Allobranchiibius sp. GilTou73]
MRVALIQLAYDDAETLDARVERVVALVREQAGHDLVVLPELWGAGGFSYREWSSRAQDVTGSIGTALSAAARDAGVFLHGGSIVERPASGETGEEGHDLWNTSVVYDASGTLVATYRKIHRFGFAGGEPKLMDAGTELVRVDVPAGSSSLAVGLSTCYDIRFPEMYRALLDRGAEAFVVPAAWPMARVDAWRLLLRARAVEDQCFVLACNTAGTHAKTQMGGHSAVIAPGGEVLAEAGEEQQVLSIEIDPSAVRDVRESFPVLADRRL